MPDDQDHMREINAFHLDKKIIWIWALNAIISSIVILIFVFALSVVGNYSVFGLQSSDIPLYLLILLFLINIIYIFWLHLEYNHYIYYFTTSGVVMKHGVITTERRVIPYERIQDIGITRSIIERFLNLATIRIETATVGSHTSKSLIPSVSNYKPIVNHILERRDKAIESQKGEKDRKIELMELLLSEVKGLKNVLSKINDTSKPKKGG